ncbi:hypothetical protein B0H16DRAFT_1462294 [Mycena metata]|uniref:Uncharacterized protein n=1 Tax=Mycena metata TaxID=1033252 RepID=A0AAD7INC6_9AGAR|nr:hypothetical protein B0H16DRAFT_1462294 [Mycena metata]
MTFHQRGRPVSNSSFPVSPASSTEPVSNSSFSPASASTAEVHRSQPNQTLIPADSTGPPFAAASTLERLTRHYWMYIGWHVCSGSVTLNILTARVYLQLDGGAEIKTLIPARHPALGPPFAAADNFRSNVSPVLYNMFSLIAVPRFKFNPAPETEFEQTHSLPTGLKFQLYSVDGDIKYSPSRINFYFYISTLPVSNSSFSPASASTVCTFTSNKQRRSQPNQTLIPARRLPYNHPALGPPFAAAEGFRSNVSPGLTAKVCMLPYEDPPHSPLPTASDPTSHQPLPSSKSQLQFNVQLPRLPYDHPSHSPLPTTASTLERLTSLIAVPRFRFNNIIPASSQWQLPHLAQIQPPPGFKSQLQLLTCLRFSCQSMYAAVRHPALGPPFAAADNGGNVRTSHQVRLDVHWHVCSGSAALVIFSLPVYYATTQFQIAKGGCPRPGPTCLVFPMATAIPSIRAEIQLPPGFKSQLQLLTCLRFNCQSMYAAVRPSLPFAAADDGVNVPTSPYIGPFAPAP